jgi:hypothetical protein
MLRKELVMFKPGLILFSTLLVLLSASAGWAAPAAQPVTVWSFNRCALDGNVILDSGPGGNDLTLQGAFCASGRYGLAGRFDGVNDSGQTDYGVLNFTDALTVSAWVNADTITGVQQIANKWYTPDSFQLAIHDGRWAFAVAFPTGGWGTAVNARYPATAGVWTHLAGVFDGSTQTAKLYVNGVLRTTVSTPLSSLQQSSRPVSVGNHPSWNPFDGRIDEVALYDQALTAEQVRSLASVNPSPFHGSDTSIKPWNDEFLDGSENGYDFYSGRLGYALYNCVVQDRYGKDILTWAPGNANEKCIFVYEAATNARPERTFPYWWVVGPKHGFASSYSTPYDFGAAQAQELIDRWTIYRHLVGGRVLFGDIERSISQPDSSGWETCWPVQSSSGACSRNRELLEGFLQTIANSGLTPGVYTSPSYWREFFSDSYRPAASGGGNQPFVLWVSGCATTAGIGNERTAAQAASQLPTVQGTVLGGMHAVIWQHHIDYPEYDAIAQNPSALTPASSGSSYACTCDQIGGFCP